VENELAEWLEVQLKAQMIITMDENRVVTLREFKSKNLTEV